MAIGDQLGKVLIQSYIMLIKNHQVTMAIMAFMEITHTNIMLRNTYTILMGIKKMNKLYISILIALITELCISSGMHMNQFEKMVKRL